MLLSKVILKNYGVFQEENVFDFTTTQEKPIVLIGGTNGAGKTTLFESVMLCLYGMSIFGKRTTRKLYEKYLASRIHRYLGTPVSADFASIIVEFQFFHDNQVTHYHVDRTWKNNDGKVFEELKIMKKNAEKDSFKELDTIEQEHWQSFIEELIPRGIAKLFFFDGEKIIEIAEEDNVDVTIKSSFNSLLGLDLVEQLRSDLQINLMRNLTGNDKAIQIEYDKLVEEKDEVVNEVSRFEQNVIEKESELNELLKEIEEMENKISFVGGDFAKEREGLRSKIDLNRFKVMTVEDNIRTLCSKTLPFTMIPKQLEELKTELQKNENIIKDSFEQEILSSSFDELKTDIKSESFWKEFSFDKSIKEKLVEKISKTLDQKTNSKESSNEKLMFDFSQKETKKIIELIDETSELPFTNLENETKKLYELYEQREKIQTALNNAPNDDELGPLITKLNEKHAQIGRINTEIEHLNQQIAKNQSLIKHLRFKIREVIAKRYKNQDAQVKADLTEKVQIVLDQYTKQLRTKKLRLLEDYIFEAIEELMHKDDFISKVTIDDDSFDISLWRENGDEILKSLLSMGEKQMLATAVLWGLAKTSGKPLPFMIDTPLARLDVEHRTNLIEKFFPFASHQTIIFSTNSEIDYQYYKEMLPYISRSYTMNYNSKKGKSKQYNSYFWDEKGEKIIAN